MASKKEIGANIRKFRLAAGLSQNDVAAVCKVQKALLSRYENGHIIPRLDTIEVLAGVLGVKPQEIVGWE